MVFATGLADEELIFWRATCMFARFDHELPVGAEFALAATQCVLI